MKRNIIVSLLLVGLGLASCGAQPDSGGGVNARSVSTPVAVIRETAPVAEAPVDLQLDPAKTAPTLSPLAAQVVALPPALPERVLDGLGDPVGTPPELISLPDLGVTDATIVPVGLEDNGELEVPGAAAVGWYRFGVGVDSGQGSTVLAAHIAYNGRDGVFRDLADSNVGDEVVVTAGGVQHRYAVTDVTNYDKLELPVDELFAESGEEQLVMITCGGSFNPSLRTYEENFVVVAVLRP